MHEYTGKSNRLCRECLLSLTSIVGLFSNPGKGGAGEEGATREGGTEYSRYNDIGSVLRLSDLMVLKR